MLAQERTSVTYCQHPGDQFSSFFVCVSLAVLKMIWHKVDSSQFVFSQLLAAISFSLTYFSWGCSAPCTSKEWYQQWLLLQLPLRSGYM